MNVGSFVLDSQLRIWEYNHGSDIESRIYIGMGDFSETQFRECILFIKYNRELAVLLT
jgi:hypothetical protein